MLRLAAGVFEATVAHCLDGYPDEACGLLVGRAPGEVVRFAPARNAAGSARVYTVHPVDHLRIERAAEAEGLEVLGVVHSHTHTAPYPSPTDVAQAAVLDPAWHFVIVSLRHGEASLRSYRIVDGVVSEEPVVVLDRRSPATA